MIILSPPPVTTGTVAVHASDEVLELVQPGVHGVAAAAGPCPLGVLATAALASIAATARHGRRRTLRLPLRGMMAMEQLPRRVESQDDSSGRALPPLASVPRGLRETLSRDETGHRVARAPRAGGDGGSESTATDTGEVGRWSGRAELGSIAPRSNAIVLSAPQARGGQAPRPTTAPPAPRETDNN